jgi:hypothetical protein
MSIEAKYYQNELSKVNTKSSYPANIQICDGDGSNKTKWLSLNAESAEVLVAWLKNNYINKR